MRISALHRKLLRDMVRLKGQVATIAIVLAGGLTCFVAFRGTYESLASARAEYEDRYRFAHVFARLERAPESLARRIEAIPGVSAVETRIAEAVSLPIEGMSRPAYGQLLSIPDAGEPRMNALHVLSGRLPERGRADEVALLASFAEAHGLTPGERVPVVIHGTLRKLRVVGLVLSPEYVYAVRPGALVDDPRRYAVLWMGRAAVAAAYELESAFNDLSLRLDPDASQPAVLAALDRLLAPYGGDGAYARKDQLSSRILSQEIGQMEALAGMVPAVFLGVAAFLINLVLGRLIRLQRAEIAALKALGYTNRELRRHYLGLVLAVLVPGSILGIVLGHWLGELVFALYQALFRIPDMRFAVSFGLLLTAVAVSGAAAALGAWLAVRAATRLPPAEAMRPPAPARYRRGFTERLGLGKLLGTSGLMVLRELERRPLRTLLSSLGIAGAVALLVLGRFGLDSLDGYLVGTFQREQRQDLTVLFASPLSTRAVSELRQMPGVLAVEGLRSVAVRAQHEHRRRDCLLLGIPDGASLRRVVERDGSSVQLPEDGVLVSRVLADVLGLSLGTRLLLDLREGERRQVRPVVVGFVDDTAGLHVYASAATIAVLSRDQGAVSAALLDVDPGQVEAVEERLRRSPQVLDVSDLRADVERLRDMNAAAMDVWTLVSITLSACVVFGVVYNNARISLEMQSRELSSLRVLGFSRHEVSAMLIGGLAVEVLLAIPIGLWIGLKWAQYFMVSSLDPETFRWQVIVAPRTYLFASLVALLAAAASALWVRRKLDTLDLIAVLKTRQ